MHKHIDPADAAAELLKRRSIRCSLTEWARYKGFEPAPHHQLIIAEIQSFLASDERVLLLFAPPGSAKSTYVSVLLPSWFLANNPNHSVLAATHSVSQNGGEGEFAMTLHLMPRSSVLSSIPRARLPQDGVSQAAASITALALASVSLAFGLTLASVTISLEVVRTLIQTR